MQSMGQKVPKDWAIHDICNLGDYTYHGSQVQNALPYKTCAQSVRLRHQLVSEWTELVQCLGEMHALWVLTHGVGVPDSWSQSDLVKGQLRWSGCLGSARYTPTLSLPITFPPFLVGHNNYLWALILPYQRSHLQYNNRHNRWRIWFLHTKLLISNMLHAVHLM